jgi:hypothetical protein
MRKQLTFLSSIAAAILLGASAAMMWPAPAQASVSTTSFCNDAICSQGRCIFSGNQDCVISGGSCTVKPCT